MDEKRSGLIGRADLLEMLNVLDEDARTAAADLLGYKYQPRSKASPPPEFDFISDAPMSETAVEEEPGIDRRPLSPASFWRLEKYTARQRLSKDERKPVPDIMPIWQNRPDRPPKHYWLTSWRDLAPRLLKVLCGSGPGLEYDLDYAVDMLARGESLDLLPRLERPKPLSRIQVIFDRSSHLIPYWFDQDLVAMVLRNHFGDDKVEYAFVRETADEPSPEKPEQQGAYQLPPEGSAVLVLSDLGSLSPSAFRENSWLRFGRRVRAAGCRPIALVPGPTGLVERPLRRSWQLIPWEEGHGEPSLDRDERRIKARRLLVLLSHAFRIEPGLLRAVRIMLGSEAGDAGTEAEAWVQLEKQHVAAGTLEPDFVKRELANEIGQEDKQLQRLVLACQREWRHSVADEIWFDEIINLPPEMQTLLPHPEDVEQSRRFFEYAAMRGKTVDETGAPITSWLASKVEPRATTFAWKNPEFARAVYEAKKDDPDFALPGNVDPENIPPKTLLDGPLKFQLGQGNVEILTKATDQSSAPHLGILPSENGILTHEVIPDQQPDPALFWADGQAPTWASGWGEEEFGPYAEFTVDEVVQRLRWVPPGRFMMGSPEGEAGRWDSREGPQHVVTLATGFWMMDTPIRQSLWQAVMGDNPSRFNSPDRPVENVDYKTAEKFIARLNKRLPGLNLSLPSEAQWEYACRAGTKTATYAGDLEILGTNNAPLLDQIAWYGGNSGVGFELADGHDSSDWDEKQYPDSPSGTHPVGQKLPNDFGLYDMLGNVEEWCADHWHDDYEGAPTDGSAWQDKKAAAARVGRGGSWLDVARHVRAAYRSGIHPADRLDFVGFRCVRVQLSDKREAAPVERGAAQQAERRAAARSMGDAAAAIDLTRQTTTASVNLPTIGRLHIISDRAELEFAAIGSPPWASHMGCDKHGLFAEFRIGEVVQRLRWIPPGRFMMGSPEGEAGRFDWEGPQHEVTLATGFWMMDTPVRQDLWQAVMDNNPSRFKSPDRPVENVDYKVTEQFITRLNERMPGLDLSLPSEAQWEYACRAGTETATYAAATEELSDIAWFRENSEKQTQAVAKKGCNAWGLHDMLGNVWEWCADHWHNNYEGAPTDGSAWLDKGAAASRVMRGGSWDRGARRVRAAYRRLFDPPYRYVNVGFRCVRVHSVATVEKKGRR